LLFYALRNFVQTVLIQDQVTMIEIDEIGSQQN